MQVVVHDAIPVNQKVSFLNQIIQGVYYNGTNRLVLENRKPLSNCNGEVIRRKVFFDCVFCSVHYYKLRKKTVGSLRRILVGSCAGFQNPAQLHQPNKSCATTTKTPFVCLNTMKKALFWHRRDLRITDNAGLHKALTCSESVQPIFIFDTNILDALPKNDQRVLFIHQQISRLNRNTNSMALTFTCSMAIRWC